MKYPKLVSVLANENFSLFLKYDNGEEKTYDFSPNLSHPFFAPLKDKNLFAKVSVVDGELLWQTGQNFCPHTLYENSI